jgi:hypothetical protein
MQDDLPQDDLTQSDYDDQFHASTPPAPSLWAEPDETPPTAPESRMPELDESEPYEMAPAEAAPPVRPSPRMAPGVGGPNLDWHPRIDWPSPSSRLPPASVSTPFEGDLAVKALRSRLSLDPAFRPEPPIRAQQKSLMPFLGRFCLTVGVVAAIACGVAAVSMPELRTFSFKPDQRFIAAIKPTLAAVSEPALASSRLVIEGRQAFANEPLPLGVSLNGAMGGEFALLTGLAAGTRLSTGSAFGATGWRLPARELVTAFAYAPQDFVGVMDTAIDLRTSRDTVVDRNMMRLEWIGKPVEARVSKPPEARGNKPPEVRVGEPLPQSQAAVRTAPVVQQIDPEELAALLKRGLDYLQMGDIAAARIVLRRAANAGHAPAALALGSSFDPYVFVELGVLGFTADPVQARAWYERAGQLGASEAPRRIERLARLGP